MKQETKTDIVYSVFIAFITFLLVSAFVCDVKAQPSSLFDNQNVLIVGDSHVKGYFGYWLGERIKDQGANYIKVVGREGWGVCRWLNSAKFGEPSVEYLIKTYEPDVIIMELGGNDWWRKDYDEYEKCVRTLWDKIHDHESVNHVYWIGPPKAVRKSAKQQFQRMKIANIIKSVVGLDHYIDSFTKTDHRGRTSDGIHFTKEGSKRWVERVIADIISR